MTVAAERELINNLFDRVEAIEEVASTFDPDDKRREKLLWVVDRALADCPHIRPVIAADLLHLSQPTIRSWVDEGILTTAPANRTLLEPQRLHEVWHLVRDLRKAGRTRGLLDVVWHRLQDRALLEREDLAESLEQMRRGQGREIDPDELRASAHVMGDAG